MYKKKKKKRDQIHGVFIHTLKIYIKKARVIKIIVRFINSMIRETILTQVLVNL